MKAFFKYFLILFTLFGFATTTFEWNKEEYKQNFKKEDKSYIAIATSSTGYNYHIDLPIALPENQFRPLFEEKAIQQLHTYDFFTDPDPPDKLYIRNSVFRI